MDEVAWSVWRYVTITSLAKMAEPIQMPLGVHNGETCLIQLNLLCVVAMHLLSKYSDHLLRLYLTYLQVNCMEQPV